MLKFSPPNSKTGKLISTRIGRKWLPKGKKLYSFDLLSGWSCPFARDCKSKVVETPQGLRIQDGPKCKFRCFSASNEVLWPAVYNLRKQNFDQVRKAKTTNKILSLLYKVLPDDAGIVRLHVGGDFFSQAYFDAWLALSWSNPNILFYAYTKAIGFWASRKERIPSNFVLIASRGGIQDNLIDKNNFRATIVVKTQREAREKRLIIDTTDRLAAGGKLNSALLLHGIQKGKKGSK